MTRVDEIAAKEMQNILNAFNNSATDRLKLESFGMFLQDYVIEGGEVTKINDNTIHVSEATISLADFLWKVYETKLKVPKTTAGYHIIFDAENRRFACVTQLPEVYIELAQIAVINGEIVEIVDTRGEVGGVRFKEEFIGLLTDSIAVDTANIVNNSITNSKISDNAISTEKIQDKAVTENKINDKSIVTNKIGDKAVTNPKLDDNAVDDRVLADNSVGTDQLKDYAITALKIMDNIISTNKIVNGAVTSEKIANGAITKNKIANGSIDKSKLAPNETFPESILRLDYPTTWLYNLIIDIQQDTSSGLPEIAAARNGYNTLSERLDSMETNIVHETFITTEGQTHFTLTKGEYEPGTNTLFVTIGGISQDVLSGLQEINSTTFAVDEPLPAGIEVYAWWYNKRPIPATYHGNAHKEGGGDSLDLGELAHNLPVVIDGGEW